MPINPLLPNNSLLHPAKTTLESKSTLNIIQTFYNNINFRDYIRVIIQQKIHNKLNSLKTKKWIELYTNTEYLEQSTIKRDHFEKKRQ